MNRIALDSSATNKDYRPWVQELVQILAPDTVPFHFRPWDTVVLEEALDVRFGDVILEFGAWNLFTCIPYIHKAGHIDVTDSFVWERSKLSNGSYFLDQQTWMRLMGKLPISVWELDIQQLDAVEVYDRIYSCSVLEHVPNDERALENVYRALKPGGVFAFTTDIHLTRDTSFFGCCRIYALSTILNMVQAAGFIIDRPLVMEPFYSNYLTTKHYPLCLRCVKKS